MRRRALLCLRTGLLGLGLVVLVWIPVSINALAELQLAGGTRLYSCFGYAAIVQIDAPMPLQTGASFTTQSQWRFKFDRRMLLPGMQRMSLLLPAGPPTPETAGMPPQMLSYREIFLPLWLVAGLCLSWPAIALVQRRLRQRRGFPVEAAGEEIRYQRSEVSQKAHSG